MRNLKFHKAIAIAAVVALAFSTLTGCAFNEKKKENASTVPDNLTKDLTSGRYYVRSGDKFSSVYFGTGTFKTGTISSAPSTRRILWYKTDFEKIPTLYTGDSLVLYSIPSFNEDFTFERFRDIGYSVGLCGFSITKTGRLQLSVTKNNPNTYPGGDTDALLNLNNEKVIVDSFGGVPLRFSKQKEDDSFSYLSDYGTIQGLTRDNVYEADIYDGTIQNVYNFKADVRILGSFETAHGIDYTFKSKKLIEIEIPEWFNSGYYLINGQGLFRYVKGDSYDDSTDFNIPNVNPNEKKENTTLQKENSSSSTGSAQSSPNSYLDEYESEYDDLDGAVYSTQSTYSFNIDNPGQLTMIARFKLKDGYSDSEHPKPAGTMITPSGQEYSFTSDGPNVLSLSIYADVAGQYTVSFSDMDGRMVSLNFV